jgi:hypothetical protein
VAKRRMGYKGAPRELLLEELKESGETLKDIEKHREKTFVKIEEPPLEIFSNPRYLFGRLPEDRTSH